MRGWFVQVLWTLAWFCFSVAVSPAIAQAETAREEVIEVENRRSSSANNSSSVATSSNSDRLIQPKTASPATTVAEWAEQIAQSLVQITDVQINSIEAGIEVVLQTAQGELTPPTTRTVGNALIADIPNAVLSEGEFSQANPAKGIALVNVTSLPGDRVRVAITGIDAPPVAEVRSEGQNLVLGVAIGTAAAGEEEEEAIELVVTGEQDEGYNPSNASTATRTDTPILEIPQSIQVIPQQVLEGQQVTRLDEALQNSSGVIYSGSDTVSDVNYSIRGFTGAPVLIDGFRQYGEYPEIKAAMGNQPEVLVVINADTKVEHGQVVAVMDQLRSLRGVKLGVATKKPSSKAPS